MASTALVAAGCLGQAAHAEVTAYAGNNLVPSINVYARIDAGLRFVNNVDLSQYNGKTGNSTLVQAAGNDWGCSMFGITGDLPLTPQTKAVYKLEAGFDATNGSFPGFNRRAYVGLSDDRFGTLLFGKDLFIDNDIWGYDPMGQENMSTSTLVYGRNWQGASDMVEYRSPTQYAVQLGLQASLNPSSSTQTTKYYGASLQYSFHNLSLLGVYDVMQSPNGYTNLYSASKEAIIGATYTLNPVELYAGYQILSAPDAGASNPNAVAVNSTANTGATYNPYASVYATHASMSWLGAVWTVIPQVKVRGAWFHTSINDNVGHANLFTVGTEYYFRPNMFWYATVGEVVNSGHAEFAADIGTAPPAPGHNQFSGYSGFSIAF